MRTIDWNEVWKERFAQRTLFVHSAQSWGKRAPSFAGRGTGTGYAEALTGIINPRPEWTVFDMGCGAGALAIPLAGKVRTVTAADFSDTMLEGLRSLADEKGLTNIRTINMRWEDDWDTKNPGLHDIAIASRSLVVEDLRSAVTKLDRTAQKAVYVITIVGDGPCDRKVFDAVGRNLDMGPDYIYNYNLLYQMGIHAKVDFITEKERKAYADHDDAFESLSWMVGDPNPSEKTKLHDYLDKHLVREEGHWKLDYERVVIWAVISWEKDQGT